MLKALNISISSAPCLWIIIVFSLSTIKLWAQKQRYTPCATVMHQDHWLTKHIGQFGKKNRTGVTPIHLPIYFHLLGTDEGEGHYSITKIYESMCRLNADFKPYDIQFYLAGSIDKINRSRYYDHDNFGDADRMMDTYNKGQVINVYITNSAPEDACGYWLPGADAITVIKNCMGSSGHTLTHEIGHYLSLLHPFNGWEGKSYNANEPTPLFHGILGRDTLYVESVTGKHCDQAGDLICDTGPDYLSLSWECDGTSLSLQKQVDPFGSDFKSDGSNFMSYSIDQCQSKFTATQVEIMHTFANSVKSFLINLIPEEAEVSRDPITNMLPRNGTKIEHQSIELSWDAPSNATEYLLQISRFSFFAVIDYEFVVTSNIINIGDLPVDKKYYWRVLPINAFDQCADFSVAEGGFETAFSTHTLALTSDQFVTVTPTLLTNQDPRVKISLSLHSTQRLQVELRDLYGRALDARHIMNPAKQEIYFHMDQYPPGPYILSFQSESGLHSTQVFKL